jgi:hypothetical protein
MQETEHGSPPLQPVNSQNVVKKALTFAKISLTFAILSQAKSPDLRGLSTSHRFPRHESFTGLQQSDVYAHVNFL